MIEIERKFIIEKPDVDLLRGLPGFSESRIVQIYVHSLENVTHRVRSREIDGEVVYTETKKQRIDKMSALEDEREISREQFVSISADIKEGTSPINKVRYTFLANEKLFEMDVYPEWKNTCILEIELSDREEKIVFPGFIKIVEEVTGNRAYSNASMARSFPEESICR